MKRYFSYLITIEQNLEDSFSSLFSDLNDLQVIEKCKSLQTAETQFDEQNCEQLSKTKRQQEIREKLKIRVNQIISDNFWHFSDIYDTTFCKSNSIKLYTSKKVHVTFCLSSF